MPAIATPASPPSPCNACLPRRVGLPLAQIGRALDDPTWSLSAATERHLSELDRRLEATARLRSRLAGLVTAIGSGRTVLIDELLTTVEEMTMLDTAAHARITLLVYRDVGAAHDWLVRLFGPGRGADRPRRQWQCCARGA
jgi:MerR family transcriptional regulator, thiopeptide resistance regulator